VRVCAVPWILWLVDLLFPQRCVGCGCATPGAQPFCEACLGAFRPLPGPLCACCGAPVAWAVPRCRGCAHRRVSFASARSAFLYTPSLRGFVAAWKERGIRGLAEVAADLTCGVLEPVRAQAIVPVPPDPGRLLRRGHHPPEQFAAHLGARWELRLCRSLVRCRSIPRQASLPRDERRRNVRDAFAVRGAVPGHVLLVDDVFTTGATASAAAQALRRAGAIRVDVVTFARAVR
jgi:predicted amidophosphoribosyltransferase